MNLTKWICLLVLFTYNTTIVLGQKKIIDSNAYSKWRSLRSAKISSDGKFIHYVIENEPAGSESLVIQSTENSWTRSFIGGGRVHFLRNKSGDYAIILTQGNTLAILTLGTNLVQYISNVSSLNVSSNEESEWIAYQLRQSSKELILQNIATRKCDVYQGVVTKIFGDDGKTIVLVSENSDEKGLRELKWIDLSRRKTTTISKGVQVGGIILDSKHRQLAFTSEKGLWTYNMITGKLNRLIDNLGTALELGLSLGRIKKFTRDGKRLFVELQEDGQQKTKSDVVEVWSYLDDKTQLQQENEIRARAYTAVVNLTNGKLVRLEDKFEHISYNSFEDGSCDTLQILYRDGKGRDGSGYVRELISLKNGKVTQLRYQPDGLSPQGKYAISYDAEQRTYVSYNTKTRESFTISKVFSKRDVVQNFERHGIAGWLENDEGVLIYDNCDVWKIDLSGKKEPVNLTIGYGKKYSLAFSILYGQYNPYPLSNKQRIVLSAFNLKSKQNGFYSLELDKIKGPELLSMGDYLYCAPSEILMDERGMIPIKAKGADIFLVSRMSAKESPNYFSTKDFKTFKPISNVNPPHEYNWYTAELQTWKTLNRKCMQGILYKPENFDSTKVYPVIFKYYETVSNNLNAYIKPETLCRGCEIDIPTYVSNGYLVFTPDIFYKIGDPMQGTYDAVVSAAEYIGALPFVDPKKIGIQGCSWGGVQTNYLVTHTNLFAAACSASGIVDWISDYGRLYLKGMPIYDRYENGQFRMGKSIWEIPGAYVKNSPIFSLDQITTPFLIMHTKSDGTCPFNDAIELFMGLRRLGKKSWMLAYSEGDHGVFGKEAEDFSIRMMQFFDHYLKDRPAPTWMTRGIRAERRGLDNGYEYDAKIKTPGPGLLTPKEQKTVDSLMTRNSILIKLKKN